MNEKQNIIKNIIINEIFDMNLASSNSCHFTRIMKQIKKNQRRRCLIMKIDKVPISRAIPKIPNYLQTINQYPEDIFYNHFRMSRNTFKKLCNILEADFLLSSSNTGRPEYPLEYCLYVTIWKLANKNTFREVSDRFCIGQSTAYRVFVKTIQLICQQKSKVIKFPHNAAAQRQVIEEFEKSRARPFPFTIGCIDGMHIQISKPKNDAISFYNRKGFHSVLVQGVVNSDFKFLDAFVGFPGSCHDAAVWNGSPLKKAITKGIIQIPHDHHLIGDAAYPLQVYLMTPFKDNGHLTEAEIKFNTTLSSSRIFVEQAFGILKKKWRMLDYLELQNITLSKTIIMSCIVLHNVVIDMEGKENYELSSNEIINNPAEFNLMTNVATQEAIDKRNIIKNLICA